MTDTTYINDREYKRVTVQDYDGLDKALAFTPGEEQPAIVKFEQPNGHHRYFRPPPYLADGTRIGSVMECIYNQASQKWEDHVYSEMVAKHVIRIKKADGSEYPLIIRNIRERDLKDELFMRGVLLDDWEPYFLREAAK